MAAIMLQHKGCIFAAFNRHMHDLDLDSSTNLCN